MYQKRTAQRRRTSDITRLVEQYQKNVQATTAEYETAFGQYQKETAEKMAPFEEQMRKYQTELYPAYEEQAARYRENLAGFEQRANEYRQALEKYMTKGERFGLEVAYNPAQNNYAIQEYLRTGRNAQQYNQMMRQFGITPSSGLPYEIGFTEAQNPDFFYEIGAGNRGYLYKRGGPDPGEFTETFTETLPTMPEAPVAPEISDFDASQFEAKRQQLETELTREVGERKSARLAAVSRRSRRPMLQGAA